MVLSGYADLPLHDGHVPQWLAKLMKKLGKEILRIVIMELGSEGLLRRLSNPLWFQAFNNAIGMDWDSSGSTTVTTAIIKESLNDLGVNVRVAGGKGGLALRTPDEIVGYGDELGINSSVINELIRYSKLSAKVDSALLQDGFSLYHHVIVFDDKGRWVVIQQGMNLDVKLARRYHIAWFTSPKIDESPHSGIASNYKGTALNLVDIASRRCKEVILDLMNENPKKVVGMITEINNVLKGVKTLDYFIGIKSEAHNLRGNVITFNTTYYRPVRLDRSLLSRLMKVYEIKPSSIEEALLIPNVGSEVYRALSLVSELIYREPPSLDDPVTDPYDPFKYAFTVGGKDGIPFPIKRELMVKVIRELNDIIKEAEMGRKEKLIALRNLRRYAPKDEVLDRL